MADSSKERRAVLVDGVHSLNEPVLQYYFDNKEGVNRAYVEAIVEEDSSLFYWLDLSTH